MKNCLKIRNVLQRIENILQLENDSSKANYAVFLTSFINVCRSNPKLNFFLAKYLDLELPSWKKLLRRNPQQNSCTFMPGHVPKRHIMVYIFFWVSLLLIHTIHFQIPINFNFPDWFCLSTINALNPTKIWFKKIKSYGKNFMCL